jgi:voltage-gated potassium channel
MRTLRPSVFEAIEPGIPAFKAVSIGAIILSILAAVTTTMSEMAGSPALTSIEAVCSVVFVAEYVLRLWTAPEMPLAHGMSASAFRAAYARTPLMLIDLAGLLPIALAWLAPQQAGIILFLQTFRFFRLARYSPALETVGRVLASERRPLLASAIVGCGMLLTTSTGMYILEHQAQPDNFGSIPQAMYWAIVTLATVGYGDVVPVTQGGKIFAGVTIIAGLIFFALPVGIIASGFLAEIRHRDFVVSYGMVARVPLFAGLDATALAELAALLKARKLPKDSIIVRKGDDGDAMYFVASGQVEVVLPENPVILQDGDFFGEMAVLGNAKRNATVIARTPCELLVLDAADVLRFAGRHPYVDSALRAAMAARAQPRPAES